MCARVLTRAREILGFQTEDTKLTDRRKSLGTAVNELMRLKRTSVTRLCHLCRIDHLEWKGRRCDKCTAFFCFRGLYRHFDVNSADVIRHSGLWTCPKCLETCNCRCCHFPSAYVKAEKPASKRRVKAADPRGKVMGFTDNVFDQKRGQRSSGQDVPSPTHISPPKSHKRQLSLTELTNPVDAPIAHRKLDLPSPEPDYAVVKKSSEYMLESNYSMIPIPRLKVDQAMSSSSSSALRYVPENHPRSPLLLDDEAVKPAEAFQAIATAAVASGKLSSPQIDSLLTPMTPTNALLGSQDSPSNKMVKHYRATAEPATPISAIPETPISAVSDISPEKAAAIDESITQIEDQIGRLRRYGDELLELSLPDYYRMLTEQLASLEALLRTKKKEKSTLLINKLARDFPGLADATRKEVEKLGYI